MGVMERRAREKEGLRKEILDAARELFVTEGYERVTMRRIAEKIEYSPTTIYLYFKDKEELLKTICEQTFEILLAKQAELREQGPADPIERLRLCLRGYCEFGITHPHHYKLTLVNPVVEQIPTEWYLDPNDPGLRTFDGLRAIVADCIRSGQIASTDLELTTQAIWLAVHGVVTGLICQCDFPFVDHDLLINTTVDAVIRGFGGASK